jgi:hypothetical protein
MNNKRGRKRLNELFSNLDLLSANPAGDAVGLQQESKHPASQVVDMEYAGPDASIETLPVSISPLTDQSVAIPSPLKSEVRTIGEMQVAPPPGRQLSVGEQGQADLKDFGIGVVSGTLVTGIILASTSQMDIFNNLGRFALLGGEVLIGVLGAFAAKSSSGRSRDIWLGAIEWSLVPVWIGLFIMFLLYALSFTNLFGV